MGCVKIQKIDTQNTNGVLLLLLKKLFKEQYRTVLKCYWCYKYNSSKFFNRYDMQQMNLPHKFMRMDVVDVCVPTLLLPTEPTPKERSTFEVVFRLNVIVTRLCWLKWEESNLERRSLHKCKIRYARSKIEGNKIYFVRCSKYVKPKIIKIAFESTNTTNRNRKRFSGTKLMN